MAEVHTVRSLIKALTEMKKLGLADSLVIIESDSGMVGFAGAVTEEKYAHNKTVMIGHSTEKDPYGTN